MTVTASTSCSRPGERRSRMDSARIWSQSVARRSLMGAERTHNPSPAAASILKRAFGKKRFTRALKASSFFRRRRAHKGNPLPAVAGLLGSGLLGKLGGRFRAPSDKRAAKLAGAVVQAANAGNLTAAAGLIERPNFAGIQKEKAVWRAAAAQVAPNIVAAAARYAQLIPKPDHSSPEAFAASVLAAPIMLADIQAREQAEGATRSAAAERRAAREEAKQATREAQLTSLGTAGLQALAGRGRQPARRRRTRRRSSGRSVRLY